ncbi:MAG: cyclopropane fatty acyl phospholipid synthase [Alphaproteobacteria bacterium]|nr:cyclopropane fatty acyl phospholipid synthase [Alphaproteobacteria bacterium]
MAKGAEGFITRLLEKSDIQIGGGRPWDIAINDRRLFNRVLTRGSLGLGEAYMDGWWDAGAVDQFIHRVLISGIREEIPFDLSLAASYLRGVLTNLQRWRAFEVAQRHYDIGNDLYRLMLDRRMIYSCGYWKDAGNLDEAQEHKLDLICKKIGLEQGMRVLDIGSGWGGFLLFAAERYGIKGVGVTVSRQQVVLAQDAARARGLPIDFLLADYHELDGRFDRVVSVGMFEHVGYKNYRGYFAKVRDLMADDGLFLLHTIGGTLTQPHGDPWSEKYIFPNGMLPSIKQIGAAIEGLFIMEDWHNFGADYEKTLLAWRDNFEANWPKLKDRYNERFHRMWRYYLLSFAAVFRARLTHLWQIVLSKEGVPGGYRSIR